MLKLNNISKHHIIKYLISTAPISELKRKYISHVTITSSARTLGMHISFFVLQGLRHNEKHLPHTDSQLFNFSKLNVETPWTALKVSMLLCDIWHFPREEEAGTGGVGLIFRFSSLLPSQPGAKLQQYCQPCVYFSWWLTFPSLVVRLIVINHS